jgi:hypothetical protein
MILKEHIPNKPSSACGLVQIKMTPSLFCGANLR